MSLIEFCCDVLQADREHILNILPPRKTKITEVRKSTNNLLYVRLHTECNDVEGIKSWVKEFEDATKSTYITARNKRTTGRYVAFKRILNCQHNQPERKLIEMYRKKGTKNTNCPSAITITLHSVRKKYKGRINETYFLRRDLPCEIYMVVTHNHSTENAFALKHRKVAGEVREKLMQLFHSGHSPSTALEMLKTEVLLRSDNPELDLADRSRCPDYMFCYNSYLKEFKDKCGPVEFSDTTEELLKQRLDKYNMQMGRDSAQINFCGTEYVICICSPLMKRVHKYVKSSSEVVFMDSNGTVEHDGFRIYVVLTPGGCGGLPLAVIIISSESCDLIKMGFQMLKGMLGEAVFGGNPDGPKMFITDDSFNEEIVVSEVWTKSKCFLSVFSVLQSVWRWLIDTENKMPENYLLSYFEEFKSILHAETADSCLERYETAKKHVEKYQNYVNYLESYWQKKEQWALVYRNEVQIERTNFPETPMKIVKEKIFNRVRAFNNVQMVDFMLSQFTHYYESRLLDAAGDRLKSNVLGKIVKVPPSRLIKKIEVLANDFLIVPSETHEKLHYIVDINALVCACLEGKKGKLCKHIDWACMFLYSKNCDINTYDVNFIITNIDCPSNGLQNKNITIDQVIPSGSSISSSSSILIHRNVENQRESPAQCLQRGKAVIEQLRRKFIHFLENNPTINVVNSLKQMHVNATTLHTTGAFVSACNNFSIEYRRKRRAMFPVQSTALRPWKRKFSGRVALGSAQLKKLFYNKRIRKNNSTHPASA